MENKIAYTLAAIGLLTLAVSTAASYSLSLQAGTLFAATLPSLLCAYDESGLYTIAAPASPSACADILGMRTDGLASGCNSMELSKRVACKQLLALASERTNDCANYAATDATDFAAGAPQANEWCNSLLAE